MKLSIQHLCNWKPHKVVGHEKFSSVIISCGVDVLQQWLNICLHIHISDRLLHLTLTLSPNTHLPSETLSLIYPITWHSSSFDNVELKDTYIIPFWFGLRYSHEWCSVQIHSYRDCTSSESLIASLFSASPVPEQSEIQSKFVKRFIQNTLRNSFIEIKRKVTRNDANFKSDWTSVEFDSV